MWLRHRPKPGDVDPERADKRCPRHECLFYTDPNGKRRKLFDCENREGTFCPASNWTWCPDGNPDRPVPPLLPTDWSREAQRAWLRYIDKYPLYQPPHDALPITIGEDSYSETDEPEEYELKVRSPKQGEERCSTPHESDDDLPSTTGRSLEKNRVAVENRQANHADSAPPSSPLALLRSEDHNLILEDDSDDEDFEGEPEGEEAVRLAENVKPSPRKTRRGTRFAEGQEVEGEAPAEAPRPRIRVVPATKGDMEFFADECFQDEKGNWVKRVEVEE